MLPQTQRKSGDEGFVLVPVLWLAALLAVIAGAFAISMRVGIKAGANMVQNAKAEHIADGLVYLSAWRLARGETPRSCRWSADAVADIAVQDQAGLADLNAAPTELLAAAFETALPSPRARKLAKDAADYRDQDKAGEFEGSKNGPFEAIEELGRLPGLDETAYRALLPLVTVHSFQQGIDPAQAPEALKPAAKIYPAASNGSVYGIDVAVRLVNGARYRRSAIVGLVRQPDRPFAILSWQRGAAPIPDAKNPDADCF